MERHRTFGEHLRQLREEADLTLREVGSKVDIDPSLLAKIERGFRQPTMEFINDIADFYNANGKDLLEEWLSDRIAHKVLEAGADLNILKVAEEKAVYIKSKRNG